MLRHSTRTGIVLAASLGAFLALVVEARACPWLNMEIALPAEQQDQLPSTPAEHSKVPPTDNVVSYQSCDPNTTGNGPARWFAAKTDRLYRDREGKIHFQSWLDLLKCSLAPRVSVTFAYQTHGAASLRWILLVADVPVPPIECLHRSVQPLAPPTPVHA
ncbi:MAG: hypothetical protein AB7N71_13940 [Phycisphaerae bacterium]